VLTGLGRAGRRLIGTVVPPWLGDFGYVSGNWLLEDASSQAMASDRWREYWLMYA
jgi:hypothetical protein